MQHKKVVIVAFVSMVTIVGLFIGINSWIQKENPKPGKIVTLTNVPNVTDDSLTAKSYEEIYNQLMLAKIRDYFTYGGIKGESNSTDSSIPETSVDSAATGEDMAMDNEGSSDFGTTNVQVQGIDEGDILKNDGKYLYCCTGEEVTIINADLKNMVVESRLTGYRDLQDIYVIGNQMVLLSQRGSNNSIYEYGEYAIFEDVISSGEDKAATYVEPKVVIDVYDITNRENPKLISSKTMEGWLQSSRVSDGYLYVIADKDMYGLECKEEEPSTYVPKVDEEVVNYKDVVIPDTGVSRGYLVIASLKVSDPEKFVDQKAIFSNGYNYYVSQSNIYIADTLYKEDTRETLITKINYLNGKLVVMSQGRVKGYIKDNFSMDEYEGYLRIVTTVDSYNDYEVTMFNNLYVLNDSLKTVGKIEKLAKDEMIYSSRFMGKVGYFVTFKQVDPLFSVDLSDPRNPKIIGKLKIPGFSTYLHFYGDNLLLGIGEEADEDTGISKGLKLSMFDISDPSNVKEVHKMHLGNDVTSEILYNYKSILVDPEKNIIGFSYNINIKQCYGIYTYDDTLGFQEEYTYQQDTSNNAPLRGTYIGDTVYILSLARYNMDNYKEVSYVKAFDRKTYKMIERLNID